MNYVEGYNNSKTEVLTCFVNPGDIISFQDDGHAIRVDALMPNNVWLEEVKLKGLYHSSTYAKISAKRLDKIIAKALKAGVAVGEEFRDMQDEISVELIEAKYADEVDDGTTFTHGGDFDIEETSDEDGFNF